MKTTDPYPLVLILISVFFTGCAFEEAIPSSVKVVCQRDEDCPEDYYCETRLEEARCILSANRDTELPEPLEIEVGPAQAKAGTALRAQFQVNDAIVFNELKVYVGRDAYTFTYNEEASDRSSEDPTEHVYVFDYEVVGNEPEGKQPIKVYIVDQGGNPNEVDLGFVTLDFQAPGFISGTSNLDWYRAGDAVTYTARFTEPLVAAPSVSVTRDGVAVSDFLSLDETASDAQTYVYTSAALTAAEDGAYQVSFADIEDVVGNVYEVPAVADGGMTASGAQGLGFQVDGVLPQITDVTFLRGIGDAYGEANVFAEGHEILVCFKVSDENLVTDSLQVRVNDGPVLVSTSSSACEGDHQFTYTAVGDENEGFTFLVIEASDVAGNRADETRDLSFDFSPPALTVIAFNPPNVREGMTATLLLTANEPLAGENLTSAPALTWVDDKNLEYEVTGRTAFGFEYQISVEGVVDGLYAIATVENLEDAVGNKSTIDVSNLDGTQLTKSTELAVDSQIPTVMGLNLNASKLSANDGFNTLTVTFTASENTAEGTDDDRNPLVTLGDTPLTCTHTELTFTCSHTITGDEPEGLNLIQVQIKDLAGNVGYASSPLEIDYSAPALLSAQVSPESAKLGDEVVLSLTFDEALSDAPTLTDDLPFTLIAGTQYSYSFPVTASLSDGEYNLDVTVTDEVGNSITLESVLGSDDGSGSSGGLQIDASTPGLSAVNVNAERFSVNDGHNQISVSFEADEALSSLTVMMGDTELSCDESGSPIVCTHTVTEDDVGAGVEVIRTITISGADAAGNSVGASVSVTLDNKVPELLSYQLTPEFAKDGDEVVLSLNFDESLNGPPTLLSSLDGEVGDGGVSGLPFALIAGTQYSYSFTVEDQVNGDYTFDVTVTDEVGNSITIPVFGGGDTSSGLNIDATAPQILDLATTGGRTRFALGSVDSDGGVTGTYSEIEVSFSLSEPLSELEVSLGAFIFDCGDTEESTDITCTYQLKEGDIAPGTDFVGSILVVGKDAAGNEVIASLDNIIIDNKAPQVVSSDLSPQPAGVGDEVILSLTFNEPLTEFPELGGEDPGFVERPELSSEYTWVWSLIITAVMDSRDFDFDVTVGDEVGNSASVDLFDDVNGDGEFEQKFEIDTVYPVIENVATSADRYSLESGHNVVTVFFTVDDTLDLGTLKVMLGALELGDEDCDTTQSPISCTHVLTADDVVINEEVNRTINISGTDTAGNGVNASVSVVIDNKAPGLLSAQFTPESVAKLDDWVVLSLAFNEPLAEPPQLNFLSGPENATNPFILIPNSQYSFSFQVTNHDNGDYTFEVSVMDTVGNNTVLPVVTQQGAEATALTIDATKPIVTVEENELASRYSLANGHNIVGFTLDANEPLAELNVDLNGVSFDCGNFSGQTTATCTYALHESDFEPNAVTAALLLIEAVDVAGNRSELYSKPVVLDNEPPRITYSDVRYLPKSGNPVSDPTAGTVSPEGGNGTEIRISFATHEPVAEVGNNPVFEVTADCKDNNASTLLTYSEVCDDDNPNCGDSQYFTFRFFVNQDTPEGECAFSVYAVDLVGNTLSGPSQDYASAMIDKTPPDAYAVLNLSGIKHIRVPYGAYQTDGVKGQWIASLDLPDHRNINDTDNQFSYPVQMGDEPLQESEGISGWDEAKMLRFFDAQTDGTLQGFIRRPPASIKTISSLALDAIDSDRIWVEVVDNAGNVSTDRLPVVTELVMNTNERTAVTSENVTKLTMTTTVSGPNAIEQGESFQSVQLEDRGALAVETHGFAWRSSAKPEQSFNDILNYHDMTSAFNEASGTYMQYGGFLGAEQDQMSDSQTWEWDGTSWHLKNLVDPELDGQPDVVALAGPSLSYHSARGVTVLNGVMLTTEANSFSFETWEYDGISWKLVAQFDGTDWQLGAGDPSFQLRVRTSSIYDAFSGTTVIFGGESINGQVNDLWEWDGTTWGLLDPGSDDSTLSPPARMHHDMAYDPVRDVYVLYGGATGDWDDGDENLEYAFDDTWEWDKVNGWQLITPSNVQAGDAVPGKKQGHRMAYDHNVGQVVLFGGYPNDSELWGWDGVEWELLDADGPQREGVSLGRGGFGMAFDTLRQKLIVSGGRSHTGNQDSPCGNGEIAQGSRGSCYHGDLWEWDGTQWTERNATWPVDDPNVPYPTFENLYPEGRLAPGMVYLAASEEILMFGGDRRKGDNPYDDTWRWHDGAWEAVSVADPGNDGAPAARTFHQMVYDSTRDKAYMFGGSSEIDYPEPGVPEYNCGPNNTSLINNKCFYEDLWEWDNVTSDWVVPTITDALGDGNPAARKQHGLVYDEDRDVVILFGGMVELPLGTACPDGSDSYPDDHFTPCFFNDHWEWHPGSGEWEKIVFADTGPGNYPEGRAGHGMAYDSHRQTVVMYGGAYETPSGTVCPATISEEDDSGGVLHGQNRCPFAQNWGVGSYEYGDIWEFNGVNWQKVIPEQGDDGFPLVYTDVGMYYNPDTQRVEMFAGFGAYDFRANIWEWDGTTWAKKNHDTLFTEGAPAPRRTPGIAYHSALSELVVFGGLTNSDDYLTAAGYDSNLWRYSEQSARLRIETPVGELLDFNSVNVTEVRALYSIFTNLSQIDTFEYSYDSAWSVPLTRETAVVQSLPTELTQVTISDADRLERLFIGNNSLLVGSFTNRSVGPGNSGAPALDYFEWRVVFE